MTHPFNGIQDFSCYLVPVKRPGAYHRTAKDGKAEGKEPYGKLIGKVRGYGWNTYRENPPTAEEILSWFAQDPCCNVGIITGEVSGHIVLDRDGQVMANWAYCFFAIGVVVQFYYYLRESPDKKQNAQRG